MNEKDLKSMVESILVKMLNENEVVNEDQILDAAKEVTSKEIKEFNIEDGYIEDITEKDIKKDLLVPNPFDKEGYLEMKKHTPARLGIWRAGPRYKTETMLRFRADHAAAQDSVFSYVSEEFVKEMDLLAIQTLCKDKDHYITRPDLGRKFSEETKNLLKNKIKSNQKVQIIVGDGLSSAAIEANLKDVLPAIKQGLKSHKIETETPIFVKHCRVPAMDEISEVTGAEVVLLLVGERPGLVTAESMSAYIAYKAKVGMPEARRTVISNIHKGGTIPVEAGAHIADLVKKMLDKKASGLELNN